MRCASRLASLAPGELHRYGVDVDGTPVRFIAIKLGSGEIVAGLDACVICGDKGYSQSGSEVFCRHCASIINPPTIGQPGGCNPIPIAIDTTAGELVVQQRGAREGEAGLRSLHGRRHEHHG